MKGTAYAILAAACNAMVGVLSLSLILIHMSPVAISFYKCLAALLMLTVIVVFRSINLFKYDAISILQTALIAFFGIFILYYFETLAYSFSQIAQVVFTLLGTSTIVTVIYTYIKDKDSRNLLTMLSVILAFIGLILFHWTDLMHGVFNTGFVFATLAGIGYGCYLIINKKPRIKHEVVQLWYMMLFGTLFLAIPFLLSHNYSLPLAMHPLLNLALLGLIPTIGGYYCLVKALSYTSIINVQISTLTEPLMASILGLYFFKQWLSSEEIVGGFLIIVAILLINYSAFMKRSICQNKQAKENLYRQHNDMNDAH